MGSAIFAVIAPGTVAILIPWLYTRWRFAPPLLGIFEFRYLGAAMILAGVPVLADSFARFAAEGLGTPAPIFPTRRLIVTGLYRYVRNPMYLAVLSIIFGQGLLFGSRQVLVYGMFVFLAFHLFVLIYEEPTMRRSYGDEYSRYCANVPRWIPRTTLSSAEIESTEKSIYGVPKEQGWSDSLRLLILTAAAVLVSGYHYGVEDMAVYLPAIKKIVDPSLYPLDANFFLPYIRVTLFHQAVASIVRLTHFTLEWVAFLWHLTSVFLALLGCLRLMRLCFTERAAQWAGVAFVAALFTLPVAGTALFIVDQHMHPRTLATALLLFAMVDALERRPFALVWIFLAGLCHPAMTIYGTFHIAVLSFLPSNMRPAIAAAAIPFEVPANPIWRQLMSHKDFRYPFQWTWYEWLGAIGPLAFLEYFATLARSEGLAILERVCRRMILSTSLGIIGAVIMTQGFPGQTWARLEPMRILHLTYVTFVLISGGVLGQYVLRDRAIRWALLFVPLACVMMYFQRVEFGSSAHIEWPGRVPRNEWVQAFKWASQNTPRNALFALDPKYMDRPGEDYYGFRGFAERSALADDSKDPSVVKQFPDLAWQWKLETDATKNWSGFTEKDFERLKKEFGVSWVILESSSKSALDCPYANATVKVCRLASDMH